MKWILCVGAVLLGCFQIGILAAADQPGVPPETVTDYLHSVIEADRTFYSIHVVERLQKSGGTRKLASGEEPLAVTGSVLDRIE